MVRLNRVTLSRLHTLDPRINELTFEGRLSNSEQSLIILSSVIPTISPIIGSNNISNYDPKERVKLPNISDSEDITSFELDDHPFPPESVKINLCTTGLTYITFSAIDNPS